MSSDPITLRPPTVADASPIYELLGRTGNLERNTAYAYLLLCSHFAGTCVVAERGGQVIGFVLGYRPPVDPSSVFVWQVGVAPEARGAGLGRRLLTALVELPACEGITHLTATVSADNQASLALFHGFARSRGVPCATSEGYRAEFFPEPHLAEDLLRIGPLKG